MADGIERIKSAKEKRINSLLINSSYRTVSPLWSKNVPSSYADNHLLRSSTLFLEKDMSIKSPSPSDSQQKVLRCNSIVAKYSFASFAVDVPRPL